jgi:ribosome recycling factor
MQKAVQHAESEFASVRTGRASSALVERLSVEYYGSEVPLQTLANFSVPEARVLVVSPFDKTALRAIERAISASDLGINPNNDGSIIRLNFPPLTEERRKELVKVVRQRAEDGRIAIRGVRRSARQELDHLVKDGVITSDEVDRVEKDLDKATAEYVSELDRALGVKEKELLEI